MLDDKRQRVLEQAFDLVKPKKNWKYPINAKVTCDKKTLSDIEEAITHFTGSVAQVTKLKPDTYHITAAGYYNTIGA